MSGHAFRPSIARVQKSQQVFTSTKTNATIRDLEEEEGELEEKEGTVVSIKRDLINGSGWTVKDKDGETYICSCASSMYEVPETVERGGILYPKETVEVVFTVNPVLRINTIKEIKSLGEETEKLDISKWKHGDESTTVIAKPKSALSISDGFIKLDYNNDNKVLADKDGVKTQGKKTSIDTEKLSINSNNIDVLGKTLDDLINGNALNVSNSYASYNLDTINNAHVLIDRTNNITQITINGEVSQTGVIAQIMDPQSIPIRTQTQQLVTDGNCIDTLTIDENGVISVALNCPEEKIIPSTYTYLTPQIEGRNYIKVIVKETCDYCDEGDNTTSEFLNYCPKCGNWNTLVDTSTSKIQCTSCLIKYCENCGHSTDGTLQLKKYKDNYITASGTTCPHCKTQLASGTSKIYANYCPYCKTWGHLYTEDYHDVDNEVINVLTCDSCDTSYCCTCGIDQKHYGINLEDKPVDYASYIEALRKLKYIKEA